MGRYYLINFGNFVEEGYENNHTFYIHTEGVSVNFSIDDSWGQSLDLEGSEFCQLTINIKGEGTVEVDGKEVTEWPYEEGEDVRVKAIPAEGWEFVEWTGNVTKDEEETTITIEEDMEMTAIFEEEDEKEGEIGMSIIGIIVAIVVILAIIGYRMKGAYKNTSVREERGRRIYE